MTDAADRKWVMQQLEAFASMLGKAVAEIENELVRKLRGEIEQLRGEVAQMKAAKPTVSAEGSVLSLRGQMSPEDHAQVKQRTSDIVRLVVAAHDPMTGCRSPLN